MKDLHLLPKVRDSWSYVYVEHAKIDQEDKSIAVHDANGKVPIPCATLSLLLLGPGTNITHAAIRALGDNGCLVAWTGEGAVRFYAMGMGETRSAQHMLRQSWLCSDPARRLAVVRRLYEMRFPDPLDPQLTLQQIRGKEGIRVREAYAKASRETGVPWNGRSYQAASWSNADPVNRALSSANSCLYGICHAAIVAAGYSPALGFIHTGKMLSFVYDIADLYKVRTTVPVAFRAVKEGTDGLERRVRYACRDAFHSDRVLQRIVTDIDHALAVSDVGGDADVRDFDALDALPGGLWDPQAGEVRGGVNHADDL